MKSLFARRGGRQPGWMAVAMQPGGLAYAHGVSRPGERSAITRCGSRSFGDAAKDLERIVKELGIDGYQCLTVLAPNEYQVLLVDAPNVPPPELKAAVRWRLKDMLDYHVDDATIDVLDIPADPARGARGHSMYAVAARNEVIRGCIERFAGARIPLSVIDIPETAQRNIAALYEPAGRGVGMLYLDNAHALLTINFQGELYLARRIDVSLEQLLHPPGGKADELMNRILLELQRSFDHLDRQFPFVSLSKLLLGPEPSETGLRAYLAANLDLPVEAVRLDQVLALNSQAELEGETAWRLFHVIGASLRNEQKSL
jgi:MSHA biogenesis protein MshI